MLSQEQLNKQNEVDRQLVSDVMINKSETSFTKLYHIHYDWVFSKSLLMVHNYHDAEDVTSIIFAKLWNKLIKMKYNIEIKGTFRSWLNVLSKHTIIDFIRSNSKRTEEPFDLLKVSSSGDSDYQKETKQVIKAKYLIDSTEKQPISKLIDTEYVYQLESALEKITKYKHRIAFILRCLEHYSITDITQILQVKDGTVKIWIFRCKQELKSILQNDFDLIFK